MELGVTDEFLEIFYNRERLEQLEEQYLMGSVVPFVGAGLCMSALPGKLALPGWRAFLLSEAEKMGSKDEQAVAELLAAFKFEDAAEHILARMGDPNRATSSQAFQDRLVARFGDSKYRLEDLGSAIHLLPRFHTGFTVTTNFDHALERIYEQEGREFKQIYSGPRPFAIKNDLNSGKNVLWKIHGDVNDDTERVLTKSDYDRFYKEAEGQQRRNLRNVLIGLFNNRTVLFLGCSLEGDRILEVLKDAEGNPGPHFALISDPGEDARIDRNKFLVERHIFPIFFPRNQYECVARVLAHLIKEQQTKYPANRPEPVWQQGIDWAITDTGSVECPGQYRAINSECIYCGRRACLMHYAIEAAKANNCPWAFRLTLITQCHSPEGHKAIARAGEIAVCDYLKAQELQAMANRSAETVVRDVPFGTSGGSDNPACPPAACRDIVVDGLPVNAINVRVEHYAAESGSDDWKFAHLRQGGEWYDCGADDGVGIGWCRFIPGDDIVTVGGRKRITAHFRNWSHNRKRDARIVVSWTECILRER
jgi:hypothetical protein